MTISTTASRISYNGNGATTAFSFPYRFLTNADLTVIRVAADGTETTLVLNTDYTVAGADEDAGGTVTIGTAPASGTRVVIFREIDITQEVDYITGDAFPAETHERAIDRLTMIAQQHQDAIDRSAKLSETSTADADTLIANINALAAIEDDVSDVAAIVSDVSDVAAIDANVTTVAGIAANVTTVAGIAANVTSVAGNATNINTVAGNNSNVTTVAGVSSAVTTVAGISSAVSTVAADGTDIGVVAGISADVQAVADIAADVAAVENIAANVTTVAGIAANVTTVAGISANVTTVAGNTTNINTVAGISANVTTVAGISADVTAVAADATDIGTVATNIADVNTVATDIADINTCADNMAAILDAPAQASAAAASAAAAAASLDNFDDRYLGSKSSAPTLDNDGNALTAGALYFNNGTIVADDKGMYVYDGGTWIAASAASQAIMVKYKYIATAGQTTFIGADSNALTLSYTAGSIIVTLNGVVMDAADYTATSGNSVVLGTGAALNDELGVFAFSTFDIANTYTQAQVDAAFQPKNSELTAISASGNAMFKNRIINGAMMIDQRNAGASVSNIADGQYTLDRWVFQSSVGNKFSVQRNVGAVTPPVGFTSYLGITSTSAYTVGASEFCTVNQNIEGLNVSDFAWGTVNAAPITISFWVRSSLTGTFGGTVANSAQNRTYPFTYTINAANTWEQKTVTIAGDTTGTWLTTNELGMRVRFSIGCGSTRGDTAGVWTTNLVLSATGAVSVLGTSGATFYITGVQLEKGSTRTSFDYRPHGTELALCQRYYQKTYDQGNIAGSTVGQAGAIFTSNPVTNNYPNIGNWNFAVPMRATPTVTGYNPNTGASGGFRGDATNYTPLGIASIGERSAAFFGNNVSVSTTVFMSVHAVASAEL